MERREEYNAIDWEGTLALLAAPFPAEAHETKKQGGATITFVSWHHYVQRLNEVCPNWTMDTSLVEVGDKLVVKCALTINGLTRVNYGDEDVEKDAFGTAITNATAQAFKRTCAMFGLGLYMYDGGPKPVARSGGRKPKSNVEQDLEGDGRGWKAVGVHTEKWAEVVAWLCEQTGYFMEKGEPNQYHILATLSRLGYRMIDDNNYRKAAADLLNHARQKQGEP